MPVFLPWRNQDNISHANGYVFFFCGHDTFAFSNNEYLLSRVTVKLVPNTWAKVNLRYDQVTIQFLADNWLHCNRSGK